VSAATDETENPPMRIATIDMNKFFFMIASPFLFLS
jgi:hypothetical protein